MAYRLAIFDFDGVLADSAPWFLEQLPGLALRHRFSSPDADEIARLRNLPTREIMKALGVSPLKMPGIAADLRSRMASDRQSIRLFDAVPEMLGHLHGRDVCIAIVSSNSEENVRAILGSSASFVSLFSCGAALLGKSRRFVSLLRRTGLQPREACAIGDEVRDIEAARKAGMPAVAVTWGYAATEALISAAPDYVARSPADVTGFLLA